MGGHALFLGRTKEDRAATFVFSTRTRQKTALPAFTRPGPFARCHSRRESADETAKIADRKACLVIRRRCPQELAEHSTAPAHPFLKHETPCSSLPPPMDGAQTSHPHQWIVKTGGLAPDPRPQSAESDGTRQGRGACKTGSVGLLSTRSLGFTPLNELCATS